MNSLNNRSKFLPLLFLFTASGFLSLFTEFFQKNKLNYSLLLLTLPLNYEKQLEIRTKVYFFEICELNDEYCSLSYFIFQGLAFFITLTFYFSLMFFHRFSLYLGSFYILLCTSICIYSLSLSENFSVGVLLFVLNVILAIVLIVLLQKRIRIEKNVVEYDIIHGSVNSIPESGANTNRVNEESMVGELNVSVSDLVGKLQKCKDKNKKVKKELEESQKVVSELKRELRQQKIFNKDLERELKKGENKDEVGRRSKMDENENLEYEILSKD